MPARYAHIRAQARRDAIAALEVDSVESRAAEPEIAAMGAQKWAQRMAVFVMDSFASARESAYDDFSQWSANCEYCGKRLRPPSVEVES